LKSDQLPPGRFSWYRHWLAQICGAGIASLLVQLDTWFEAAVTAALFHQNQWDETGNNSCVVLCRAMDPGLTVSKFRALPPCRLAALFRICSSGMFC